MESTTVERMRVAVGQAISPTDELLAFARQLGVTSIQFNTPSIPGEVRWEVKDLLALRRRCESYGLTLEAIENMPDAFYQRTMLGLPGRDEEIENIIATIRNMGEAGIPILGYHFMPASVWRTGLAPQGRGKALVSVFDLEKAQNPANRSGILVARRDMRPGDAKDSWMKGAHQDLKVNLDDNAMWDNYTYFVKAVVPEAERASVKLALHPDDPPVPQLANVARLFRSVDALKRASNIVDSPAWGLDLCLGTVSEMGGESAVLEAIRYFGSRNKIFYVHLRDVIGTVPRFEECFLGEGNYRPRRVLQALGAVGFTGFILDDHVPAIVNDSPYNHRGRAYTIGYIQGLLESLDADADGQVAE